MTEKGPISRIELLKANFYRIIVRIDDEDPDSDIMYSLLSADCPLCGGDNEVTSAVEQKKPTVTCGACDKDFALGELDDTKSFG